MEIPKHFRMRPIKLGELVLRLRASSEPLLNLIVRRHRPKRSAAGLLG